MRGVGYACEAIANRGYPVMHGVTLVVAAIFVLVTLPSKSLTRCSMGSASYGFLPFATWAAIVPGVAIALAVLGFNPPGMAFVTRSIPGSALERTYVGTRRRGCGRTHAAFWNSGRRYDRVPRLATELHLVKDAACSVHVRHHEPTRIAQRLARTICA
jgi:hypothetical protein